ncbi:MAG: hypothetical protein H0U70_01830 [Tatlockia sp.]|nr:hypothetical protein [Tatlockia sp.]
MKSKTENYKRLTQASFFPNSILTTEPTKLIYLVAQQEQCERKNEAIKIFLETFNKVAALRHTTPFNLAQALSGLAHYFLNLDKFSNLMQGHQWLIAYFLNEQALNIKPDFDYARAFKQHTLANSPARIEIPPYTESNEVNCFIIFNQSLDDFVYELDTYFSCSPDIITPILRILSQKIMRSFDNPEATELLNKMIEKLKVITSQANIKNQDDESTFMQMLF